MGEEPVRSVEQRWTLTPQSKTFVMFHCFLFSWMLLTLSSKSNMQRSAESITAAWYTYTYRLKPFREDKISCDGTQVIELRNSKGASQESQGVTAAFSR